MMQPFPAQPETAMKPILTLTLTLAALLPLASHAADLTLDVQGLDTRRLEGAQLMVAVYTEPANWLKQPPVGRRFSLEGATDGRITVVLKDLPDGPIALTLFQDANGNNRLDMNAMGMPTEPFGFSNDAVGQFGPPKFEQAVVRPVAGQALSIRLN
jgi:uncharacterized protein (DUF2141 family)